MKKEQKIVELAALIFKDRINFSSSFSDKIFNSNADVALQAAKVFYSKVKDELDTEDVRLVGVSKQEMEEELSKFRKELVSLAEEDGLLNSRLLTLEEERSLKQDNEMQKFIENLMMTEDVKKNFTEDNVDSIEKKYLESVEEMEIIAPVSSLIEEEVLTPVEETDDKKKNKKLLKSGLKKIKSEGDDK